ncbi:MAG: hypothetical protein ACKV2U_13965 [Bryobacteraceae bacterium]
MRLIVALTFLLGGCAPKRMPPPASLSGAPSFIQLEAGWRVRVITPMLKSGGFLLKSAGPQEEGGTITLRAGDEFQGFETAIYAAGKHKRSGVAITLAEVTFNRNGELTHPAKSFAPRLRIPGRLGHVRLLFTRKVSEADHNMAVLAAANPPRLAALTQRVQAAPETACRNNRNEYCEWIPAGVAVRAERSAGAGWVAVR